MCAKSRKNFTLEASYENIIDTQFRNKSDSNMERILEGESLETSSTFSKEAMTMEERWDFITKEMALGMRMKGRDLIGM